MRETLNIRNLCRRALAALVLVCASTACDSSKDATRKNGPPEVRRSAPKRVITISPNATEMIVALGAGDRLVGVSDFCRLPAEFEDVPRVGGILDPNLERILRLKPDLVILRGKMAEVERLCEANGIPLYRDPTERFDDVFRTIGELGGLLGREKEASALVDATRGRIDRITRAVAGRHRPRVLFTTERPVDTLARVTTSGRGTFVDEIITRAGGENIFGKVDVAYPEVSLESILIAAPEVIIEVMPGVADPDGELRDRVIQQWKQLGSMPATRIDRIHVFVDAELVIPSPRIADSIARLAALLHPEVTLE